MMAKYIIVPFLTLCIISLQAKLTITQKNVHELAVQLEKELQEGLIIPLHPTTIQVINHIKSIDPKVIARLQQLEREFKTIHHLDYLDFLANPQPGHFYEAELRAFLMGSKAMCAQCLINPETIRCYANYFILNRSMIDEVNHSIYPLK